MYTYRERMIEYLWKEFMERIRVDGLEEVFHGEHLLPKLMILRERAIKVSGIDKHACGDWWMRMKQNRWVRFVVSTDQLSLPPPLSYRKDIMNDCISILYIFPQLTKTTIAVKKCTSYLIWYLLCCLYFICDLHLVRKQNEKSLQRVLHFKRRLRDYPTFDTTI